MRRRTDITTSEGRRSVALEVALQVSVLQWTALCGGGACVSRLWNKYAVLAASDEVTDGHTCTRALCRRHARGMVLPSLPGLPAVWRAEQRLRHLESEIMPMHAKCLLTAEVVLGGNQAWVGVRPHQLGGASCCMAVAVLEVGSQVAYTTQETASQRVLPAIDEKVPEGHNQHCRYRLRFGDLWVSWLRQFRQQLRLPLQERAPFCFPNQQVWTGRVLCDLRMPHGEEWAYLRVSTQEELVVSD